MHKDCKVKLNKAKYNIIKILMLDKKVVYL